MAIIALRAWYIEEYEPIHDLEKRPPDIRLSKKSLLKSALRADFLEDIEEVRRSDWFRRYLEGDNVEFYVEGSGGYCVANIDLISHEIYFTKQSLLAQLEPTIFLSSQTEFTKASEALQEGLKDSIGKLNQRSRLPLKLIESPRIHEGPLRLSPAMMRKIRKCLLFIADATPVASVPSKETAKLIPSPNVCIEMGYAFHSKRAEQIMLAQMQRNDLKGEFSFDLQQTQILQFTNSKELNKILTATLETQLLRYRLFI